jgi:pyridoxamine 5'-phosphate oxidase
VRVSGTITQQPPEDVDAYFHSRSRKSQLGAAASQQSRPLPDRAELEAKVKELDTRYPGEIPRPEYWRGYVLAAESIEFWQDGPDRLHNRILFTKVIDGWSRTALYP